MTLDEYRKMVRSPAFWKGFGDGGMIVLAGYAMGVLHGYLFWG